MRYTSATAFRQALEQRLKNEARSSGLGLARLRKRVAFELFLRRTAVRDQPGIRHLIAGTLTAAQAVEQNVVTILKGNLKLLERFTELFLIDA